MTQTTVDAIPETVRFDHDATLALQEYARRLEQHVAELARDNERLAAMTRTAPSVGLCNRPSFLATLPAIVAKAVGESCDVAVLVLQIDDFSGIISTGGMQAGARAEQLVADVLRRSLGLSDTASFFGEGTFAVALPQMDGTRAWQIACQLIERLAGRVSLSIGLGTLGGRGCTSEQLLACAYRAMHQAKLRGGDQIELVTCRASRMR